MLFNSPSFCLFFVVVTALYYWLPWRLRWKMLLVASCIFYMAFIPAYILILFATILIDYCMGLKIAASEGKLRRLYLWISIAATCLVLFIFKYFGFFAITVRELQTLLGEAATFPLIHIILPIGLSFHTFQSLSYVVEVYHRRQAPERNFGIYALYVMFYPQLVTGPIERPQNLLHQFYEDHKFDLSQFASGLRLVAWGFFQKMVVADRVSPYVNAVYGQWQSQSGLRLLTATAFFAIQIYADFAGYSNIAIGCARMMGFKLMQNFAHPYFASSVREFWKRWHISLSTWFRDYVYIPLGGNRTSVSRHFFNLLITFTVSGLWHGANWTFIIWGMYHGILLVIENLLRGSSVRLRPNLLSNIFQRSLTLVAVCFGWIFFRAPDLTAALGIIHKIAFSTSLNVASIEDALLPFSFDNSAVAVALTVIMFITLMFAVELVVEVDLIDLPARVTATPYFESLATIVMFQTIMFFGILRTSAFIYFQF